jgi:YD repeat-containing protein
VTDPKGTATPTAGDYTTIYTYDTLGQLNRATDANGHHTDYSGYDLTGDLAVGYPKTITDHLQKSTSVVYDARGNVTQITDAKQKVSIFNYDVFGRPLDSKVPKDQAANPPVFITTPAPTYDANDNVTQATAPNGAVITAVYDNADQTTSVTLPKDHSADPARTWTYAYDAVGNLTKQTEPNGTLTSNPDDFATSYGYDELNRVTSVTDALGDKLTYDYDNVGNTVLVVDPRKNATADPADFTTRYIYDLAHRPTVATDALGFTTSYDYDKDGQVTGVTDKENHKTVVKRDERAMVSEVDVPHATGSTRVTQYDYDPVGNRTKTITPRGVATTGDTTDFVLETVYDELNRPKAKKLPFSAADPNVTSADEIDYTYDDVGNLAKVSAPPSAGQTVRNDTTYSYFDNGWVKSSTDPQDISTSYDYNPSASRPAARSPAPAGPPAARRAGPSTRTASSLPVATTASRSASRSCWSTTPTARTSPPPARGRPPRPQVATRATTTPPTPPGPAATALPGTCTSPRTAPTRSSCATPARLPPTRPTPSPTRPAPPGRRSTRRPTRAAGSALAAIPSARPASRSRSS